MNVIVKETFQEKTMLNNKTRLKKYRRFSIIGYSFLASALSRVEISYSPS